MSSTMEKVSTNKIKLRMELGAEAFEEAMQNAYLKTRGDQRPGLKGQGAHKLIERMYGESVFMRKPLTRCFLPV